MKTRRVICGECGEAMGEHMVADDAMSDGQAESLYFQFHARDDMNAHVEESSKPHSGSTSKVDFGPWSPVPE